MESLESLTAQPQLKLLLIGDSGAGKTTFSASLPRPHIADFDGKVVSAANFFRARRPEHLKEVTFHDYTKYGKFGDKQHPAEVFNNDMGRLTAGAELPFETFVLDSLTTFSDLSMEYLIAANPGIKRTVTKGAQMPVLQDYQMARIWFKQMVTALLSLDSHVIVTAHIQTEKDEMTGQILRTPMMAGKLARELPIYFGEVWRAYRDDKGEHWAQTQSDSKFNCRSQIPGLPNPVKLDWNVIKPYLTGEQK